MQFSSNMAVLLSKDAGFTNFHVYFEMKFWIIVLRY